VVRDPEIPCPERRGIPVSMPQIPQNPFRPSFSEVIIDLLESIALEETAISRLLHAKAEEIQAFVGKNLDFPTCPTTQDVLSFNHQIHQFIDVIVMKEWLLLRKFEQITHFEEKHSLAKDLSCPLEE
jgi:hypothetical protein